MLNGKLILFNQSKDVIATSFNIDLKTKDNKLLKLENIEIDEQKLNLLFQITTIFRDMGEFEKALEYQKKSLKLNEEILGENHPDLEITHLHLNDGTVAGMRMKSKNCFSVQYHPEASPGPHDSSYLFDQFIENINIL